MPKATTIRATLVVPLLDQNNDWLKQSLDSALSQSVPCELIVIPSPRARASNFDIVSQYRRAHDNFRILNRGPDVAFAGAINMGIRASACDRVGLLFTDDWLSPRAVEVCLPYDSDIVSTSQTGYAADGVTEVYHRTLSRERFFRMASHREQAEHLGHFFLFRRTKLLEVGGVDESIGLTGADDFDLIWTLLENRATVSIVEESLYFARDHHGPRLTLREKSLQVSDLEKILAKHGVEEREKPDLIRRHSRWYGQPIHEVLQTPLRPDAMQFLAE
jgi:hypothetical protein